MYHYYDLLFKEIFGTQKNIIYLEALLEDLKELPIGTLSGKIKILNGAPLNKTNIKDKNITSDVLAKVEKETINLEMYTYFNEEAFKKSKVYLFRLYSTQLKVGEKYQNQPNVSQYNICLKSNIPQFQKFQSGFTLKETYTNDILSDDLAGHVYHLDKKFLSDYTVGRCYRERLIKMFQIIVAKDKKERRKIAKGDDFLMGLVKAIERYLYNKETREMKNFPDKWRMEGRAEGRDEGRAEGRASGLVEGKHERSKEIAKNLLSQNIDLSTIMKSTGLTKSEITKLL